MRRCMTLALSLVACSFVWAQSQFPPPPIPPPSQYPPSPGTGSSLPGETQKKPNTKPPVGSPGRSDSSKPHQEPACTDSSELDGLMAETRNILATVVTSDGMAKYLDDENKAFGKSASWKKVHFRMQTILAIAQNANANK